jgi:hypothetical protein
VATVAALQARAGGGKDPARILLPGYDPVLVVRRSGRRMNPSTEDRRRDGAPIQTAAAGTGSDALVPERKGGEIARSVPAEVRARAQSAYKEAYTRAYRAYLGASPAAGDPTATPRAGCNCPSCKFLLHSLCLTAGEVGEQCATKCFLPGQDPNKFCLYCVGSDGSLNTIGVYDMTSEWQAGLEAEQEACGCGKLAGQPAGSCGRLRSEVQDLGEVRGAAPAICCYPFNEVPCYSYLHRYRRNCYLDCGDPPCPQGKACAMESLPNGQAYICTDVEWEEYNCSICCSSLLGSCSGLDCPADCPPGFSKQYPMSCGKVVPTVVQGIPYECNCR